MTDDYCGWETNAGTACEHPASESNGRCWQHAEDARKGGRPTKFNDDRARAAIDAAETAKSIRGCARAAGVAPNTIRNWLAENPEYEDDTGEYREFLHGFMRARAKAESILTWDPLVRPDEVNGSHARFLLKTSFGYRETDRLEIEEIDADADASDTVAELEDLFTE